MRRAFPGCRVTCVDLSPHMVAVGRYLQEQRLVRPNPGLSPPGPSRPIPAQPEPVTLD